MSILILGDICPSWKYRESFETGKAEIVFGDVLPALQAATITVANLEAPATENGTKADKIGVCLRCVPGDLGLLKAASVDVLSLANNHILDYGESGLFDTLSAAKQFGITTFGAGKNAKKAAEPLFLNADGKTVCLMSFAEEEFNCAHEGCAGANKFDPYESLEQIREAKQNSEYLIVLYHGGIEHYEYPSPYLQKKCRAMVCAGANLVLCQHSHCIGTYEVYRDATILYGQGNAVFGRMEQRTDWNLGLAVTVDLSKAQPEVSFRVTEAQNDGICYASDHTNAKRLSQLEDQSACLNDPEELKKKWEAFCEKQTAEYFPMLFGWGRVGGKLNRMLKGKPVKYLVSRRKKMIAMNLVRCDAHREVVQTILENTQK